MLYDIVYHSDTQKIEKVELKNAPSKVLTLGEGKAKSKAGYKFFQSVDNACFSKSPHLSQAVESAKYLLEKVNNTYRIFTGLSPEARVKVADGTGENFYSRETLKAMIDLALAQHMIYNTYFQLGNPSVDMSKPEASPDKPEVFL